MFAIQLALLGDAKEKKIAKPKRCLRSQKVFSSDQFRRLKCNVIWKAVEYDKIVTDDLAPPFQENILNAIIRMLLLLSQNLITIVFQRSRKLNKHALVYDRAKRIQLRH